MSTEFLVGIEIHRVLSYHKLFCNCKYQKSLGNKTFTIEYPHIGKSYKFNTDPSCYCRYEEEQSPPVLQLKVLKKAIQCVMNIPHIQVLDRIKFSRKHILDGSIPKGYQISGLIARNGYIALQSGKRIEIDSVYLEQDACNWRKDLESFCVDRLGLPLIEVTTKSYKLSPQETMDLMRKLEYYLNLDKNLPKSSFSIRQDINLSMNQGPRIEIKGIDSLTAIPKIFEQEFLRLESNPEIPDIPRNWTETRKVQKNYTTSFLRYTQGSDRLWPETDLNYYDLRDLKIRKPLINLFELLQEPIRTQLSYVVRNKHMLHVLKKLHFRWNLRKRDYTVFITLCNLYNRKALSLFLDYLNDRSSFQSLRKGNLDHRCYTVEHLIELYNSSPNKNLFYKTYNEMICRSFQIQVSTNGN
jgi:Glu-tRNA(Gln) amidotransferase subunit E-like FAD-binding protein